VKQTEKPFASRPNLAPLLVALFVSVVCLALAFLPRSPQPPPNIPPFLRIAAGELSDKYWLVLLVGGIAAIWRRRSLLVPLPLTMLVAQLILSALKILVGEMRPDGRFFDSFPSGHATASFAFATVLLSAFPRWGWLWVIFATLVGISRILVNAHWWHDVVGGAALGYLVAVACLTLWHRWRPPSSP
jgi:PAP2 superfamily.